MAAFVRLLNIADNDIWVGLAADTKPSVTPGTALAYETDTGNWFIYNTAGSWVAFNGWSGGGTPGAAAQVSGNVASAGTDSGNPVKVGFKYNSTRPTFTDGQRADAQGDSRGNLGISVWNGVNQAAVQAFGDGITVAGLNEIATAALGLMYNGTTYDRVRNNVSATLLASGSRTTTQTSADIPTYNFKAITVILDTTTVGSGSVTVTIKGKDLPSGKYYTLLSGAAVVTDTTNVYSIGPSIAETANVSTSKFLPAVIQIVVTANNANAAVYSVGYNLMI